MDISFGDYTKKVIDNYSNISGRFVPELFLRNYIKSKKIYAKVNSQVGKLDNEIAEKIIHKADNSEKLTSQDFMQNFPIDQIQSGGGTSTNMAVNEFLSGDDVHPNNHVNMSQSSNDTFPGVTRITTYQQLQILISNINKLEIEFTNKAAFFKDIQKVGRTHVQDAVPMTLGEEFSAFAESIKLNKIHLATLSKLMLELNFGGTAIGSLQNVTEEIREKIIIELSKEFGINFRKAGNFFRMGSTSSDFEKISAGLSSFAQDMIKILADLRLLTSGPRAGLGEINLPEVQAGSSIMPGKVNPSIVEAFMMICMKVLGNQTTISIATQNAQLQLQVFMPVIAFPLFESLDMLNKGIEMLISKCLVDLSANEINIKSNVDKSFIYATDYSEKIGYDKVSELVKKAYKENLNLKDLLEAELKK